MAIEDDVDMRETSPKELEATGERDRSRSRSRTPERREDSKRERRGSHHRSSRRSPSRSRTRSPARRSSHRHRSPSEPRYKERERERRRYSRSRSYDRDRERDRERSERDRGDRGDRSYGGGGGHHHRSGRDRERERPVFNTRDGPGEPVPQSKGGPMNASIEEAAEHAKKSVKENRLYVGNLTYNTTFLDLQDFMKAAGDIVFAEIFVTPEGRSKGCGIVEYADNESAQKAIAELSEQKLLGRNVFIREDREAEARFGAAPIPGKIGMAFGEAGGAFAPRGGFRGGFAGGRGGFAQAGPPPDFRQLFVGGLPVEATWQDMKDLFREAGNIIRADVQAFPDGSPKGNGIVVYESHEDAKNAIDKFNGYSWFNSTLQVRPDRFAAAGRGGFGGRGGFAGGFGARGGFAPRGSFNPRGGFGGGFGVGNHVAVGMGVAGRGGRFFSQDIYAPYGGPDAAAADPAGFDPSMGVAPGLGVPAVALEPSTQIMVRNLPWSTSNEDLVELFETTGQVVLAEILLEGARSKGSGVVQFKEVDEATQACEKFTGYVYGGRPLDVRYNDRWHTFTDTAQAGTT